jgi:hypothetical protein
VSSSTYVSTTILDELYSRVKSLEYRVSQHDAQLNVLDWEVNKEDFEQPVQLELDV